MSWALTVFGIAYPAVALLLLRPVAGHFAWHWRRQDDERRYCWECRSYKAFATAPNGEQWFGAFWLALTICALWPLALVWVAIGAKGIKLGAERQAILAKQRKRIAELERELGVAS